MLRDLAAANVRIAELEAILAEAIEDRVAQEIKLTRRDARIAELEAERDSYHQTTENLIADLNKARARIAELEAEVVRYEKLPLDCEAERDRLREELAALMIRHSFATGHGDTISALLDELDWQLSEQKARNEA